MYFIRGIEKDELPTWQRVRTEVYLSMGFITSDALSADGLFVDSEDHRAHHLAAFDTFGQMVGTFRLIMRTRGRRLPIERDFGIRVSGRYVTAELSGLAVLENHRDGLVMLGLLRGMYDLLIDNSVHAAYAELEKPLLSQLKMLGFPFEAVGPQRTVYNTVNWPTRVLIKDILSGLAARDLSRRVAAYAPFFSENFDGLITPASYLPREVIADQLKGLA